VKLIFFVPLEYEKGFIPPYISPLFVYSFRTPYFSQLESAEVLKISFKSDPGKMVSVWLSNCASLW